MVEKLNINELSWEKAKQFLNSPDYYGVEISKSTAGTTIIDAGIKAPGGFEAGKLFTELCLGGVGTADLGYKTYGEIEFPTVTITSDHPAIAMLGSQFAGWRIKDGDNIAIGSGPARAIALKPKEMYEEINYTDQSDKAVIMLETNVLPSDILVEKVCKSTNVNASNLIIVAAPTASVAGLTQVSGRIVETGIHKLHTLGLDPKVIRYSMGYAPIPPVGPDFEVAMARTNDVILYGGVVYLTVYYDDEVKLKKLVEEAPSVNSKDYGKPFLQIFLDANKDFYKIDPKLFAPAVLMVNNAKTGKTYQAGHINPKVLSQALGF